MVRFHLSLNVSNLDRSVAFYRTLFGLEPAKLRSDYAKFEPDDPPLVLSLEPTPRPVGGPLNHVGFRMPDAKSLVAVQTRLEQAGLKTQREEGVECCYARQTKFWAHDPDGTLWEVYTLDGDIDHRGDGQSTEAVLGPTPPISPTPTVWEHRMGSPLPDVLPFACGSVDEVRLRGTFNLPLAADAKSKVVRETARVLKPGGRVFVHVLTGDRAVENPALPGPAGAVRVVPVVSEPLDLLRDAGFVGTRMIKYDAKPCFVRDGVAMRETQIEAFQPAATVRDTVDVLYKGPFRELADDTGSVFLPRQPRPRPRLHRRPVAGRGPRRPVRGVRSGSHGQRHGLHESLTNNRQRLPDRQIRVVVPLPDHTIPAPHHSLPHRNQAQSQFRRHSRPA